MVITNTDITDMYTQRQNVSMHSYVYTSQIQITLGKEERRTTYCTQRSQCACEIRGVMRQEKKENMKIMEN